MKFKKINKVKPESCCSSACCYSDKELLNENEQKCHVCGKKCFSDRSIFYKKNSVIEADFKKGGKTKYVCYYNKLTYSEAKEVKYKRADWAFILKTTKGKISKSDCLHKNPYGNCCISNSFKKAIEKAVFEFNGGDL